MNPPYEPTLPFFTYGLFRPGQIGYGSIRALVEASEEGWVIRGELLERDGLPLLAEGTGEVPGWLIRFKPEGAVAAFTTINSIEPNRLYRWDVAEVERQGARERANVLVGRSPRKGSIHAEYTIWEGDKEPLFTAALDVIEKSLERYSRFEWDLEPFFQLQMAYMLLWTSIERFVSFKYHLGDKVTEKVFRLADDPVFARALRDRVKEERGVYRSDDPTKRAVLIPDRPRKALEYYYQIRSNIAHRGKTAVRDHEMLRASLDELLGIFKEVLTNEFSEAQAPAGEH
jgi:hypothetical protein